MKNISKRDHDFLQGVWKKARYIEYLKHEEEIVKENSRKIRRENIKTAAVSILAFLALVSIVKIMKIEEIWAIPLGLLILGSFYEYKEERITV